ncbi:sugar O-acyltransferase, sialic acid O-acetyltransferase NeuD family [Jannaschia faecimaris]|uniref:Sugar O-acyltransferase, sialic acid O-acetyltransferase NeuD family n=1 Tax=Jannaschia faecimaris TaxID=1244108 RepID=A0A1H3K6V8_9RHOB|nr:acetyltransferase [Jannaschia faecimaris]SDY47947.1 sugar O-acyltransferase, sialic acid O-acetyltransferase NeuD family [Jannaschia faecimaris]
MSDHKTAIWLFGAGGHAASILEVLHATGMHPVGVVDPYFSEAAFFGIRVHADFPADPEICFKAVVAIGDNATRRNVMTEMSARFASMSLPSLIHPSATVSHTAEIGPGTIVFQNAVIGSACRIGAGCVVNTTASVDHECSMGDYASVAPRATLGGRVSVGELAFVGMGTTVLQGRLIGERVVLGANSLVTRDLNEPGGYWGTPARFRKSEAEMSDFLAR